MINVSLPRSSREAEWSVDVVQEEVQGCNEADAEDLSKKTEEYWTNFISPRPRRLERQTTTHNLAGEYSFAFLADSNSQMEYIRL